MSTEDPPGEQVHAPEQLGTADTTPADARKASSTRGKWGSGFRWVFWRRLAFGGLAGALVFFGISMGPSLLPRDGLIQGIESGVLMVIGYGLGAALSAVIRNTGIAELRASLKGIAWLMLLGAAAVLVPLATYLGRAYQQEVRDLMGMPAQPAWEIGTILVAAAITAYLILVISRVVRGITRILIRFIDRFTPRMVSIPVGVITSVVILTGIVQGFLLNPLLDGLNSAFSVVNEGTTKGITQPANPERSGSPDSLVPWDTLGVKGRDFAGGGPTAADIESFNSQPAKEPIRVYVGLESAGTTAERVDLAMQELDRTGAWDRDVLGLFTTTGTGWVDERATDPLEYMHGGDTSVVALQYSYLPSWISFLVDQSESAEAARMMFDAVHERWARMPAETRPKLLLFGESLGSAGTESAFADVNDMIARTDGVLLVGPVFHNPIHNQLTIDRQPRSPFWRPVVDDGLHVRFAVEPSDLALPPSPWNPSRIVYLQNSTDPITYWQPDLLWSSPEWLNSPRGPDVSPNMFWLPIVTVLQVGADLAYSKGVPAGHGHVYGANPVDAWAAIYPPADWTAADTKRLRGLIE